MLIALQQQHITSTAISHGWLALASAVYIKPFNANAATGYAAYTVYRSSIRFRCSPSGALSANTAIFGCFRRLGRAQYVALEMAANEVHAQSYLAISGEMRIARFGELHSSDAIEATSIWHGGDGTQDNGPPISRGRRRGRKDLLRWCEQQFGCVGYGQKWL